MSDTPAVDGQATNPFRTFWDLGYRRLIPIVPPDAPLHPDSNLYKKLHAKKPRDDRGKAPGQRDANGLWWGMRWIPYEATESDLERWHGMSAGVGLKTGAQGDGTSLVAIDADTLDDGLLSTIEGAVRRLFGLPPTRIGNYPKSLYVVRIAGETGYQRIDFNTTNPPERVELLSDGRQFVAHGIHPKTRRMYEWRNPLLPYDDLPIRTMGDLS